MLYFILLLSIYEFNHEKQEIIEVNKNGTYRVLFLSAYGLTTINKHKHKHKNNVNVIW
jgi:hypothetical protein